MTASVRAALRPFRRGQVAELIGHVSWLLGERRWWILLLPVLGLIAAGAEVLVLVSIVRALLLLADEQGSVDLELWVLDLTVEFDQLALIAGAGAAITIVIRVVDAVVVGRLAARAAATARSRLIDSYFDATWQSVARTRAGHLQQLLGANVQTASTVVPLLGSTLAALMNLLVYGSFVAIASPVVAGVFVVLGGAVVAAFSFLRRRTKAYARGSQEAVRDLQLLATSLAASNRELRLFNVQDGARRQLQDLNARARTALRRLRTMQRLLPSLFQQLLLLGVVVLVVLADRLDVQAAAFGTAAILAVRSLSYLQQLNNSMQTYVEAAPYMDEIRAAVARQVRGADVRGDEQLLAVTSMELRDVDFAYDSRPALCGVTLKVEAGDWLGVIGPSGGGKTTLGMVFAGLLEPTSGRYLVNGRDARSFDATSWASHLSLLSQESVLLRGTVADNVRFFRDGDLEAVRDAARRASVLDDVERLPAGWETVVGDGAGNLSGGQRQRIGLARALFGQPKVLILDEPTSALDSESEREIERSLRSLPDDMIVIVISHRPTLLGRCTRFVRVDAGIVEEIATADRRAINRYVAGYQGATQTPDDDLEQTSVSADELG